LILPPRADDAGKDAVRLRRITLESPAPVPFWEAIDGLCRAGGLEHDLQPAAAFGPRLTGFRLFAFGGPGGPSVVSDSGPYRVKLLGLNLTRERDFTKGAAPGAPGSGRIRLGTLTVRMVVVPEPGLWIRPAGAPVLDEAADERGNALRIQAEPPQPASPRRPGVVTPTTGTVDSFELPVALALPAGSRTIARLRGRVPIVAAARGPDPLVIPLQDAVGRSFQNDDVTIQVHDLKPISDRATRLEATVRSNHSVDARSRDPEEFPGRRAVDHLRLADAQGREVATGPNQLISPSPRGVERIVISFASVAQDDAGRPVPARGRRGEGRVSMPVELRYYTFIQTTTDVPFDFPDIPMP
jgi:hypothetical protein